MVRTDGRARALPGLPVKGSEEGKRYVLSNAPPTPPAPIGNDTADGP